jgi:hypothetical protein
MMESDPEINSQPSPLMVSDEPIKARTKGWFGSQETWIAVGILLLTLAAYLQVVSFFFVSFDDPVYLTRNPIIQEGLNWTSLKYAFAARPDGSFLPLNWLSHAACVSIFGAWAGGHHLVNLMLHAANSVLLFYLLKKMTKSSWPSAGVAFLFALHPLHVESVAWVSERKDVLSTLFWILTTWAYLRYVERPTWRGSVGFSLLFVLGLLSKSMLVTLPLTLLLLDMWPLGRVDWTGPWAARVKRLWPLVLEKIPLFGLSFLTAIYTFQINHAKGHIVTLGALSLRERLGNALSTSVTYLQQMFWPVKLSVFYAFAPSALTMGRLIGSLAVILGVSGICLVNFRRRPYLGVGWLWYLITLLPVVGIIQVGSQSHADRYTYVPLIGIFVMLSWLAEEWVMHWRLPRRLVLIGGASILGVLFTLTFAQVVVWRDNVTLFKNAFSLDAKEPLALLNLGDEFAKRGRFEDAYWAYKEAVQVTPDFYLCHLKAGAALEKLGRGPEAMEYLKTAKRLQPSELIVDQRFGQLLTRMGRFDEAEPFIQRVRRGTAAGILPTDPLDPHASDIDWATILISRKHFPEAIEVLKAVLVKEPKLFQARGTLGLAYRLMGQYEESLGHLKMAAELSPGNDELLYQLGTGYTLLNCFAEARQTFERMQALSRDSILAKQGLRELEQAQAVGGAGKIPVGKPARQQ